MTPTRRAYNNFGRIVGLAAPLGPDRVGSRCSFGVSCVENSIDRGAGMAVLLVMSITDFDRYLTIQ